MKALLRGLLTRPARLAELLAASLLINLLGLASTAFVMLVLARYIPYGVDATLATLTVGVVLAALLELGFREARRRLAAEALAPGHAARGSAAFAALLSVKAPVLDRVPHAIRLEMVRGAETVERTYNPANLASLLDVPFAAITVLVLMLISPALGLVSLAFIAAAAAFAWAGERWARRHLAAGLAAEAALGALTGHAAQASDGVRAFNAAGWLMRAWDRHRGEAADVRDRIAAGQGIAGSVTHLLTVLQGVAVIAIGAVLSVKGELTTAQLIGANILAARALGPVTRLAQLMEPLARAGLALRRIEEFVRLPREQASGSAVRDYSGRLELSDLAFAHAADATPLAEHLTLALAPGATLLVAGPSGSGKTTFARLLLGLAEPLRGRITVDGIDMRQLSLEWWRRQVCYLPQEPDFPESSVADILRTANPELDQDGLYRAIAAAGLKAWLDSTPAGLDTAIVANGRHLPPGLRRRLALARALATGGRLCVFDEPTEGLDAEARTAFYATLTALAAEQRTIVVCGNDPGIARGATLLLDLGVKPVPRLKAAAGVTADA
ncbi:ATP-binding cassette domain-containing protein [Magnetospirillum sp. UT-4]|uniref:ATP-binding cassette domain-containing protein n=1 Tax=Magnetospirillum sp. UT-4 TaxID=2681467 RepID=UPI00137CD3CB|nr:ATP-binding cassette domain-containing protein [Magnetospirillum sp. UT-4]CAA7615046.1 ABC transporter, transmembrane region:ABC transporter [Magnetospirillum sp. UT-4]